MIETTGNCGKNFLHCIAAARAYDTPSPPRCSVGVRGNTDIHGRSLPGDRPGATVALTVFGVCVCTQGAALDRV